MYKENINKLKNCIDSIKNGGKVLIATMDSPFLDSDRVFPYLGILYLLSVAKDLGYNVRYIKDLKETGKNLDSVDIFYTNSLDYENSNLYDIFDIIGLSVLTPQSKHSKRLFEKLKKIDKNKTVIIGGSHPRYYLDECLEVGYDIIVQGEGERIFKFFLEGDIKALNKFKKQDINSSSIVLQDVLPKKEMNNLPLPLREEKYILDYKYELEDRWATTMVNSRGCPMGCKFCEHSYTGGRWYSVEHFDKEIRTIKKLGIKAIMIFDDLFAISSKVLKPYADIMKKYNKSDGLIYRCFTHARSIANDQDLVPMLAESGCVEVGFGAESCSQKILDTIGKNITVDMNRVLVEKCIKHDIKVKGFFMFGLPGETHSSAKKTFSFIKEYREKFPSMFGFDSVVFFPYKGTVIGNAARLKDGESIKIGNKVYTNKSFNIRPRKGLTWKEIDHNPYGAYKKRFGGSDVVIETYDFEKNTILLTAEEIEEYKEKAMQFSNRYVVANKKTDSYLIKEGNIE